jgi:hypothetical protein
VIAGPNLLLIGADDAANKCARLINAISSRDVKKAVFDQNAAFREGSEATEATKAATMEHLLEALNPLAFAQDEFIAAIQNELKKLEQATSGRGQRWWVSREQ